MREMGLVLDGLRLRAVGDELDLIANAGPLSPDSQERFRWLNNELSRLKTLLSKQQASVA